MSDTNEKRQQLAIERLDEALRKERDDARALLDLAWDKLPEGYTVLRGQIMTALGRQGCTQCGYPCGEWGEGPACAPYP